MPFYYVSSSEDLKLLTLTIQCLIYARPKQTILETEGEAAKSKNLKVTLHFMS